MRDRSRLAWAPAQSVAGRLPTEQGGAKAAERRSPSEGFFFGGLAFFCLLLEHAFQNFGHIFHRIVNFAGGENRTLMLKCEHDRVAWACIDLDDLFAKLV